MMRTGLLWIILLIPNWVFSEPAKQKSDVSVEQRIRSLEEAVEKLDLRLGVLSEKSNLIAGRTVISYLDAVYLRTGLNLLFPRRSTFSFPTDTGLGMYVGAGKYFGRNHVLDGGLDWDFYPAVSLRYRYEWRNQQGTVNVGPVAGLKVRLAQQRPLDNYLDSREELKAVYGVVGISAGFPLGLSVLQSEVLAFFNQQLFVVASMGLHFFL